MFVPDARVGHAHDMSLCAFWQQHFRYGLGAAAYWAARRRSVDARLTVEPPGFYRDLLLYAFRHRRLPGAAASAVLVAISQVANALGFVVASRRTPRFAGERVTR